MAEFSGGIIWYEDTLTPRMALFVPALEVGLAVAADEFAREVEDYAQAHAPWHDRTGDARRGLTAWAEHGVFRQTIILAHTVNYGLWLEVRWSGRYAIIMPTIEAMGPRIMGELSLGGMIA